MRSVLPVYPDAVSVLQNVCVEPEKIQVLKSVGTAVGHLIAPAVPAHLAFLKGL
jgi:hypothetical protein